MQAVEFGIGYGGVFAKYKVFESAIWQHAVYGQTLGACAANGNFYDAVIPNYFDPADFEFSAEKDDYFLYVGRVTQRKGVAVAEAACKREGARLIIAGPVGDYTPTYGEAIGPVGVQERSRLMSRARALFAPTQYLEPFGGVTVEARLCGTPVLATPWGAFVEHVTPGVDGYLPHTLNDWVYAMGQAETLDRHRIRRMAVERFGQDNVRHQYQSYFERLLGLWGEGWNA